MQALAKLRCEFGYLCGSCSFASSAQVAALEFELLVTAGTGSSSPRPLEKASSGSGSLAMVVGVVVGGVAVVGVVAVVAVHVKKRGRQRCRSPPHAAQAAPTFKPQAEDCDARHASGVVATQLNPFRQNHVRAFEGNV